MGRLLQRVVTGVVLAAIVLGVLLWLPPAVAGFAVAAFLLLAAWEWSAFVAPASSARRYLYTGALGLALLGLAFAPAAAPVARAFLYAGLAWWVVAFGWILRYPTPMATPVIALAGVLTLLPAYVGFRALLGVGTAGAASGPALAVLVLAIVWSADIGAYFVGSRVGRTRLAPAVSPGKTWEGVGGGVVAAVMAAVGGALVLGLPLATLLLVGFSVAVVSVVGDLAESMFKRHAGVKDSGRLFPGHGGVLDRVDSIAAAVPFFVIEAEWLGLVRLGPGP